VNVITAGVPATIGAVIVIVHFVPAGSFAAQLVVPPAMLLNLVFAGTTSVNV
jgi:hypothetical protein